MPNTRAATPQTVDTLDPLATPRSTTIKATNLRECMVLLDPELGTPSVWLDHKLRATRDTYGEVAWLAHNLDTGRLETVIIHRNRRVAVLAA